MSVHSKPRKMTIRFQAPSAEETFRKNAKKAMQARTERPPEDFGASEMGFGGADMQENSMKKIRIIREEVEESFQLTVGDLKRIINEELGRLDEQSAVSEQTTAPPFVPGSPKVTGTDTTGRRFNVPVGDTDPGDEETSKLPPGLKLIEPHAKLSSASRSSLTRKETPQWTREEGMVFISQDKSSHGEHQFAQDPYTYDSDGDDYIVISGPRPGAIGKKIRKDATSPRMKKAHALLDKRLGKASEVAIGAPDPGEPEAKDAEGAEGAEGAEQLSSDEIQKEVEKAVVPLAGELRDRMEDPGVVAYVDSIDEIIDGYTTRDDFEVAWSMTYNLINSDGDLLPKSRVANGVYAEESGFDASDAAMIGAGAAVLLIPLTGGASLAALGGSLAAGAKAAGIAGAAGAAATGAGFAGLTGLTAATSTAAAFYAGAGATTIGGALAADALIEKGYSAEAGILAAMSSTELADDWASEASGENQVEKIIGDSISNVWRKIATDPTYNKSQALSDLKKPLDAQKINWRRFEQDRGFIGSVFGQ
jgi:hypothetical protein